MEQELAEKVHVAAAALNAAIREAQKAGLMIGLETYTVPQLVTGMTGTGVTVEVFQVLPPVSKKSGMAVEL